MRLNQVTLAGIDYAASVGFYRTLGLRQIVAAPPHYARFETSAGETLSVDIISDPVAATTMVYFEVDDVDAVVAQLAERGLVAVRGPADEAWLWREARFTDPAGNPICIYHAGDHRRFPPWRIAGDQENR